MAMKKKYCAYICTGCGIGESLDIEKLAGVAEEENFSCKSHNCFCSDEGLEIIKKDVAEGTNALAIVGCSKRVNFDIFKFDNCIVERVNIREQVVWPFSREKYPAPTEEQKDDESFIDKIQMAANDYLKMGITNLTKIELPEALKIEGISKKILVIGGGITGISAALDIAKTGYEVTIVEKEATIGGFAANIRKQTPVGEPYDSLLAPVISEKITQVEAESKITVKTETVVARIAGQPGEFIVTFKKPGEEIRFDVPKQVPEEQRVDEKGKELDLDQIRKIYNEMNKDVADILEFDPEGEKFGAVVLAAGWRPNTLEGEEFNHLLISDPDVISNTEFEKIAKEGKIKRPSDGKEAKSVVFVQSPDKGDNDKDFAYTGSVTSLVALKQAKYVREDYEDGKSFIIYQHMRTPGFGESFYKGVQQDKGIFLTKGEVIGVEKTGSDLIVTANNTLLGKELNIKADLVVLANGMTPLTVDDPIINLAYRQGPGFRDNDIYDGYADSNFICFPYETQRTGVYAAGAVRRAMTIEESIEDASGAALKAIQCIESSNKGVSVHPRSGDMALPDFFFQRCTQCKRCTEECPFGALDDDEKGTPKPNPTRCRRCGTCMGACPERIISFVDYSIDSIGSQIKGLTIPSEDDFDEPPLRILALICENDALPALDIAGMHRLDISPDVRFIPVRCLGSVNVIWIKDALAAGYDGAILLGCKHGDDYQCHFIKGSELANIRMKKIGEALSALALEQERVKMEEIAIDEYKRIPEIINAFVAEIEEIGPNPFKGF